MPVSVQFHNIYDWNHINTHHRHWDSPSFLVDIDRGKPVTFNEYFSQGDLSLEEVKGLMDSALNLGCHVNYYGFRFSGIPNLLSYDPFNYKDILEYAGQLARSLNS